MSIGLCQAVRYLHVFYVLPLLVSCSVARYRTELKAILEDSSLRSAAYTPDMGAAVAVREAQETMRQGQQQGGASSSSSRPG